MKNNKLLLWGLVLAFAVLMSVPYLVPHCGFFALFALVPLLCMDRIATLSGTRRVWIYHYCAFVLWNTFTTFWVCNATIGGGLFAILYNSSLMSLVFGVFRLSKKHFRGILPYILLVAMWIAWERAYFDWEISWPWLVLGNSFARSVCSVQWYEYTGALGGSLWIWLVNLTLFLLMVSLSDGSWSRLNAVARTAAAVWTVLIVGGPFVVSRVIYARYQEKEDPVEVYVFQPNIDPYNKFEALSQQQQNNILLSQIASSLPSDSLCGCDSCSAGQPLLLLAPETFTNDIIVGRYDRSVTYRQFVDFLSDYPGVNLLFGASSHSIFTSAIRPSYTARLLNDGRWVESHNSALMVDGTGRVEIYHKTKLVVGVEMMPCPWLFTKVDDLLGGVMGRCVGQDNISLLHAAGLKDTVAVGSAVCYESVYGEFYTGYARAGAEVMAIITNDAWWKDTPGYRQHLSYASLRAIETRRSIARCANTGISCFIDQRGVVHDATPWWEQAVIHGAINRNSALTFFVRHGDITGRVCTFVFFLLVLALMADILINFQIRRTNKKNNAQMPADRDAKKHNAQTPAGRAQKNHNAQTPAGRAQKNHNAQMPAGRAQKQ